MGAQAPSDRLTSWIRADSRNELWTVFLNRIAVGTASWTDKTLITSKKFYPRGCNSAEDRLRYYATQFPVVEVDSSYYASPQNSALWVERTPPDFTFTFNIKAFRLFTGHQTAPSALPKDVAEALGPIEKKNVYYKDMPPELLSVLWQRFRDAIEPLHHGGKLGAVLFQFAPWVAFHPKSREHIDECQRRLDGYQLAVEFRNKSWFEGKHAGMTLDFERERGLVNVIVDEPKTTANSIPSVWEVTVPKLAIVRLHGRNHETWNIKGDAASQRFNYDYSDEELEDFARKISDLPAELSQVIFNNNYERKLPRQVDSSKLEFPPR